VSTHAAKEIGELLSAVDHLRLNGFLGHTEALNICHRIRRVAEKHGLGISMRSVTMQPLQHQVRVHWCGSRGQQINRYYSAFNMPDEHGPPARKGGAR
jgi:hypothetical protein